MRLSILLLIFVIACNSKTTTETVINYGIVKAPADNNVVAIIGDQRVTKKQLNKNIEVELYELEEKIYNLKMDRMKIILLEKFMNEHPGKKGITNDQFLEKYITPGIKVSESEFKAFVKKRGIPDAHISDDIKDRIQKFLIQDKKKKAIETWITKNSKKQKVEMYFPKPSRPVFEVTYNEAPTFGDKNAVVTIVEYSDFQCPFSKQGSEIIKKIKGQYGTKVRVVHKNFPLPFHKFAKNMALASICAWEQGNQNFWPYYENLFENQTQGDEKALIKLAKNSGLKIDKFTRCLKTQKYKQKLDSQIEEANNLGIKSTPTFYVNGKIISGAQKFEVFKKLINQELSSNKNTL